MAARTAPVKPSGLLRWGFNLPILLYHAHLGWLLRASSAQSYNSCQHSATWISSLAARKDPASVVIPLPTKIPVWFV